MNVTMRVKTMGFTLGLAVLLGVTSWAGAGSQAAPQGPEDALRLALSDRAVGPASQALVTAAPRPGAAAAALAPEATLPRTQAPGPEQRHTVLGSYGRLPLSFTENQGQADARIAYYMQSPGHSLYFTTDGHVLRLTQGKGDDARAHTIKVELVGAATERIESLQRAPGIVSYFKGPKDQWKTAIPTHARIGYVQPWPGIDLAYAGSDGRLESIYTVAPHADPAQIKLRYSGHDSLRLDERGNLVYATSLGEITETAPVLYQEIEGRRLPVEGRYILLDAATVAFEVSHYNPGHALVIDPTLAYAGYIGGNSQDVGFAIAVDSAGNAYVTGRTASTEASFPVTVGPDLSYNGGTFDAFVAKVNPAGTALVYAGYIGGNGNDEGRGIAVDSAGAAYVTGFTNSTEASFPVTVGPDLTHNGLGTDDAFVAKVNAAGTALVYAGYIGGNGQDQGLGIAVDSAGNAYVTGSTDSTEATFPVTVGPDLTYGGGGNDAFVAKVNPAGTALVYAGYIGGSGYDVGYGIAVDSAGNAYVTGVTTSDQTSFPVTVGPDLTFNGSSDAFVAKVNPAGTAFIYAGYIGGNQGEVGYGIAVDSAGNAYVTGYTTSSENSFFPLTVGPDLTFNGGNDAFVAKVNAAGTALVYCGYIGGSGDDRGTGIAVDSAGNAYVTGFTNSTEATFPVLGGPGLTFSGVYDAFVAKVNAAGTALVYAGYIGGTAHDDGFGIAVDSAGNAYVTGSTISDQASFPVIVGPDLTHNGSFDAFVAKIAADGPVIGLQGSVAVGGAPVGGTKVQLKNLATAVKVKTTTDAAGAYQFDPVASGNYKVGIGTFVVGGPTTVSGTLKVKGAPSVGTKLKLKNKTTGVVRKTTTDASGNFSFAGEAPGTHKITISPVPVP